MIKKYLQKKMIQAFHDSEKHISAEIRHFPKSKRIKVLDVGCGNGKLTLTMLHGLRDFDIYGVDMIDNEKVESDIKYTKTNLIENFPYEDNCFDVVISNQVIEHILNKDNFLSECYRILKMNGLFLCCTDNISSWDNIVSLLFGQEPVSQHTGSRFVTNSFFSPFFMRPIENEMGNLHLHKNVSSYFGLQRLVKVAGFRDISIKSWGNIIRIFEKIFPIYNRIILIKATK